jgi:flagellar motor switch protein FliM
MMDDHIDGGEGRTSEDEEALMAEWAAMAGGDDGGGGGGGDGDAAAAAEWEAMLGAEDAGGGGGDMGGGAAASARVLNQDEIDSLLGFDDGAGMGDGDRAGIQAILKAEEWDNFGLLTVDSSLIYSIVDVLLGGRRGTAAMRIEGRPYTTIERNLVERMVHVVLSDLSAAFDPLSPVTFRFDRLETNPRFAAISRPSNAAIVAKLRIDMEDRGGRLELMLPYATLEPVRELLLQMFMGEKFGRDSIWETHLAEELWLTELEMEAVLDEQIMPLRDILRLRVGSKIMLNATPDSTIELRCGDVTMFGGKMGRKGNHIAIRVEEAVKKEKV